MFSIQNDKLKITVQDAGAELCKINSVKYNTNFMWHADPDIWGSYAPNLFPIIGALKADTYSYEDETYKLPKHGFVRHNTDIVLQNKTENSLIFKLTSNDALLKIYPFRFEFYITYKLEDNRITIKHTIKNCDTKTMYFSVGGHPAFKCPVFENENYEDYYLEFEHAETSKRHLINMDNGLMSSETKSVFDDTKILPLTHELFNEDALIFKDLKSRNVALKSKQKGDILSVSYEDFEYLGIWAKPNGNYVCIEPWLGIADYEDTNQNLKTKEGILELPKGETFKASYTIEIAQAHLI